MRGNPKIDASNQTARVCIANSARFFILAIFGFPLNTPLPTRHAHSPFATAQGAPCQKRGFGAARYRVAREARFRATFSVPHHLWGAAFIHTTLCGQFLLSMFALSCDRARGAMPKARSFGYCFSSRARSAVSRDIFCSAPPLGCGIHSHHSLRSIFFRRYLSPFSFQKEIVLKDRGHLTAALSSKAWSLTVLYGCAPSPFSARVNYFYAGRSSASSEARNASGVP